MKKTIFAFIGLIALIFICTSGLMKPVTDVFVWLITLNYNTPDISLFGQLVAKYGTWIITFSLVGALFKGLKWFNSDAMKIVYFIVSTIISFLLSWLIMVFEKYFLIIAIVVSAILLLIIAAFITLLILSAKKQKKSADNNS